jgi:hypothetical protein
MLKIVLHIWETDKGESEVWPRYPQGMGKNGL